MTGKPFFRGRLHQILFFISLFACAWLISKGENLKELIGLIVYSFGLLTMLGTNALYHRIYWSPENRKLLKKFDHAGIYLMIAGTFTPVTLLSLSSQSANELLIFVSVVTILGIVQSLFFTDIPKIASSLIYISVGFLVLPYLSELAKNLTIPQIFLFLGGGAVYTFGGIAYGFKWPRLNPKVFGYHEFFHIFVSLAAIMHFIMISLFVI